MAEGGFGTTEGRRPRVARGRPNWWVILAVSLALMALLVATAGNRPHSSRHQHGVALGAASDAHPAATGQTPATPANGTRPKATTTTTAPRAVTGAVSSNTSLASSSHSPGGAGTPTTVPSSVTTTTAAAAPPAMTTTTTAPPVSSPSDRTQTPGILNPPGQRSNSFAFTGSGPTTVSVLWSGSTYLTLLVSCPSGSQSVGGTSAMQTTLADASGNCLATVSEPASESTALTYTITIGPAGG